MSQPPNAVLNGPSPENLVPFKDAQAIPDTAKTQNGTSQQYPGFAAAPPRPTLNRLDSRTSLPLRPGFPQQAIRPQQIRQPIPGQQFQRPPLGSRSPQFNPGARPILNPNFRPSTPFPRPQGLPQQVQRQPGIFQQRSVPVYPQTRPTFEGGDLLRSQTLDSSDSINKTKENIKENAEENRRSSVNPMQNRSFSLSSNVSESNAEEEKKTFISNISSAEEKRAGSIENLDKKFDGDYPSRPESRSSSKMNKIIEDEDKNVLNKTPPPVIESPKSVDFKLPVKEVKSQDKNEREAIVSQPTDIQNSLNEQKPNLKNLELKNLEKAKSPSRSEGDNDSGVDESTQGNDQSSNGDQSSPRKSSGKNPNRTSSLTPTKNRSLSRGSKSPSLKSPDSTASTPGTTEKKKVSMNKIQVGSAPSPNLKVVRSKIGSLENATYKPGGGNIKIENKKIDFKNAASRIEAKNEKYAPKGGDKKIQQQKLQWNAKSKIGSFENTSHKPKGGDKKIESVKLDFKDKAKSKVGSKDNIKHVPGGGDVKFNENEEEIIDGIENKKLDIKANSKVGSLENVKHRAGGGEKKIFDDKEYLKQMSTISSENHSLSGSQNSLPSQPEAGGPVADENLNQER